MSELMPQCRSRRRMAGRWTPKATEELFALDYLANGYNATAAYRSVHPKCSQRTAEVNGSRLLRKAEVRAFIEREQKERQKRLRMDADEALEGITRHARANIRKLFKDGRLLPMNQWPDDIADCVKSIKHSRFGPTIVMSDALRALELMAVANGVLKQKHQHGASPFDHAALVGAEPPSSEDE